jgi:hypothetical protein
MKGFATLVLGMILGAAGIVLGGYCYFITGRAPVATSEPPLPFEKKLAHGALNARIEREMPKTVPLQPDEDNLAGRALLYRQHSRCVMDCRGRRKRSSLPACSRILRNCWKEKVSPTTSREKVIGKLRMVFV